MVYLGQGSNIVVYLGENWLVFVDCKGWGQAFINVYKVNSRSQVVADLGLDLGAQTPFVIKRRGTTALLWLFRALITRLFRVLMAPL